MDVETLILSGSYLTIFLLMIGNGAASFPSSQLLYIVVGYFIAKGTLAWTPAILLGALGNTVGTVILYEIVRRYGRETVLRYRLFDPRLLAKVELGVKHRGWWFLFFGKLLPAIKVFVPIPAGLGKMHRGGFASVMFVSSTIWAIAFTWFGYLFGKSFHIFGWYGIAITAVALVVVLLFFRYIDSIVLAEESPSDKEGAKSDIQ